MDLISKMPNVTNKKAFVFSTSGQGKMEYNNYAKQLLRDKGFEVIGNFACKGFDTYGPFKLIGGIAKNRPNENDMEMAKYFARKFLVENISEI
jgi:flavodoxin